MSWVFTSSMFKALLIRCLFNELKAGKVGRWEDGKVGRWEGGKCVDYGALLQTSLKGASTLKNPDASRCAPALNLIVFG